MTAPHVSLACFLVLANLGIVYVFNAVNKYGTTWREGSTVQFVLHLDRMVTGLAVVLREHLPYPLMQAAGWLTLVVEALLAVLILWPEQRLLARPLAMLLMVLLHGSFGVLMRLGPFSWFMLGWSTLLLQRAHWEALEAWHRRKFGGLVLTVRPSSPLALAVARVLDALEPTDALAFESGEEDGSILSVRRGETALRGREATRAVLRALPLGFVVWPTLHVATLGQLDRWLRLAATHDATLARWFGLDRRDRRDLGTTTIRIRLGDRLRIGLREATLGFLLVCALSALMHDNKSVSSVLKHEQPRPIRATIGYLRVYQGWGMFAPNPVREDGIGVVEAWTIDGRKIDPFTGATPDLDLTDARGLGLGQIEQDYWNRLRLDRNRVYHQALSDFLQRWHRFTGAPNDELVAFDVWWLRDKCPEPRRLAPTDHEKICLFGWRKPGHRQPSDFPSIPRRCKEASAEKKD